MAKSLRRLKLIFALAHNSSNQSFESSKANLTRLRGVANSLVGFEHLTFRSLDVPAGQWAHFCNQ